MDTKISWCLCLIATCLIKSSSSSSSEKQPLLYGGQNINPLDQRHLVRVRLLGRYSCSGSILNSYWILTAAHCIIDEKLPVTISHFMNGRRKNIAEGIELHAHPKFINKNFTDLDDSENDIGLVKTKQYIRFNYYVAPIQLAYNFVPKTFALVSGYGNSDVGFGIPRQGIVILDYCGYPAETVLCSNDSVYTGIGDSGGPLVVDGLLTGVVSAGSCEDDEDKDEDDDKDEDERCWSSYANVAKHVHWILSIAFPY